MELSFFLAQLFGLTMIIFSVLAFFRPAVVSIAIQNLRPYSFGMLIAGFGGIVAGLAIILSHNIWEFSWRGLVTLFGWSALLKGITYIAFPNVIIGTASNFLHNKKKRNLSLLVAFLVGCYLAYSGFCPLYR